MKGTTAGTNRHAPKPGEPWWEKKQLYACCCAGFAWGPGGPLFPPALAACFTDIGGNGRLRVGRTPTRYKYDLFIFTSHVGFGHGLRIDFASTLLEFGKLSTGRKPTQKTRRRGSSGWGKKGSPYLCDCGRWSYEAS